MTSVAVLTALAVDLAYSTRVSLELAASARDELRAEYLARSAVGFSRLLLHFQQRLDQAGGLAARALAGQSGSAQFSLRLWEMVPVDSDSLGALLGDGGAAPGGADRPRRSLFAGGPAPRASGDARGAFRAFVEDEDSKVNVAQLAGIGAAPATQLLRLLQLVKDPKWDFLFDRDDAWGGRYSRTDVAIGLKDWVDEDEVTSAITGNPASPFQPAFGDENFPYDRGEDRYRAKNARFDSLDELYLVAGIGDDFLAAFGDRLTVFPDVNAPINVNTSDRTAMLVNVLAMSNPPGLPQPPLLDPTFGDRLQAALFLARPLPFMSLGVQQFAQILSSLGIQVQPVYLQAVNADARSPFGSRSLTFRVRGVGTAGRVRKILDVVVTFDGRAGALANDLGRLIHWREE